MDKMQIPAGIESAIRETLATIANDAASDYESWRHGDDLEPEEIEYMARDGFIPYTNGGFTVSVPFDIESCISSGRYPCELARTLADRLQAEAWRFFPNDSTAELLAAGVNPEDSDAVSDAVASNDRISELFSEYEREYCSTVIWIVFRVVYFSGDNWRSELKEDEVMFANYYNDSEHCGDHYNVPLYSVTLPAATLADTLADAMQGMRI